MKRKWLFKILRYVLVLLIAFLICWGFYGFIKDDNWIAVSALATLVLALGAFLAIWQNRSLQIRERKERLLSEIIEWAIDVSKCGVEKEPTAISDVTGITNMNNVDLFLYTRVSEWRLSFEAMRGRSRYISNVALTFEQDFQKAVDKLIEDLEEHIKLIYECQGKIPGNWVEAVAKVDRHKLLLGKSANNVIEEAVKIKTKD